MGDIKNRKFKRIASLNLVTFVHFDENMNPDYEGAARTLDISENGILLEFFKEFGVGTFFDLEIAIQNSIINVRGKIANAVKGKNDKFRIGVQFTEISNENREIIKKFLNED